MSETKILSVTAQDIAGGEESDAVRCPFALAAQRLFGTHATAVPADILVWSWPDTAYWDLDEKAVAAIRHYDQTGEMEPGEYTITRREDTHG